MSTNSIFEQQFSNNFAPNILEKYIMRYEKYRLNIINRLIKNRGIFLDLACGNGQALILNLNRFSKLYGFDVSKTRIIEAKKALKDTQNKVILKRVDLNLGVPLQNASVDTVICEASLSYFIRPDQIIEEIYRVLKPGGEFIVQVGNYAFFPRRIKLLMGQLPKISSFSGFGDGGMLHYFTYQSLKQLLKSKKFIITHETCSGLFPSIRRVWPELFASDIIYRAIKK